MEKLIIQICASKDSFDAYSVNCDGIYAAGNTIEECKKIPKMFGTSKEITTFAVRYIFGKADDPPLC